MLDTSQSQRLIRLLMPPDIQQLGYYRHRHHHRLCLQFLLMSLCASLVHPVG
jgi:hypothetical protein